MVTNNQKEMLNNIDSTATIIEAETVADNQSQTSFISNIQSDIQRFIINYIEIITIGQIKSLKERVSEYKKADKDLQKKYEELLKELHHLKGKFETLEKYGFGAIGFLVIQFLILLGIFFGYINPILSIVKTNPENINNSQQVIPVDKNK